MASALLLGLTCSRANASAFQLIEQNASGLGNSYAGSAAIADNASTIFYNPAGMTRLPGVNLSAGMTAITTTFKFSDNGSTGPGGLPLGTNQGGDAGGTSFLPNLYASWQLDPSWFVGLGVGAPYGLSTDWDSDWVGRYQSTRFDLQSVNINPSVAYKASSRLSLGVGLDWLYADADYRRNVPTAGLIPQIPSTLPGSVRQALASQLMASPDMNARARLHGSGWGWNMGLLYRATDQTRIGLAYRSRVHVPLEGTTSLAGIPGAFSSAIPGAVDNSASATLPDTATLSVVHDINSKWQVLADLAWTGWSSLPELKIHNGALGDDTLKLEFRNTWRVALGANYQINGRWKLRTGVSYDQSPIRGSDLRPTSLPDNDRVSVALGVQYRFNQHATVDVGYEHLFFHSHINNATNPAEGTVTGTLNTAADLVGVQVSYRF
ncbi:MAG TPA: outer membrane protein transport protein [Burkholderiaceae bacterium]|nr:outer membrane protein transport protein [Burkholderiaceae bacterium]